MTEQPPPTKPEVKARSILLWVLVPPIVFLVGLAALVLLTDGEVAPFIYVAH